MTVLRSLIAAITSSSQGGGGGGGGGGGPSFGSWTIEWWQKKLSPQTNGVPRVFACGVDTSASIGYSNESGGDYVWTSGANGPFTVGSIVNAWHHFSINSDGTNLYVFMDGVSKYTGARTGSPITDASTAFLIGGDTSNHWKGRITDFHIMKGGVKYLNPGYYPNARITPVAETVLLLPFTAANNYDASVGPNPTNYNAIWSTDDPFNDGDGSIQFDGTTGCYLSFAGSSIFALDS